MINRSENSNHNPGDEDAETGEKYTNMPTFLKMFFMFVLLVVVSQFVYNSIIATIKHFCNFKELSYLYFWFFTIIFVFLFIFLERFVIGKPFKSFY